MSWWDKESGEGSDDEGNDGADGEFSTVNDRIIFLIDGRAAMSEKNANGETHLQNSLTISLAVMKSKIIASGENASIGLAFFGTKDRDATAAGEANDGATSTNGVLTLFNLSPPSAQRIRQLQSLIDNPAELAHTVQPHPQTLANATACPIKQALWTCSQSFGANDYRKSDMKRIWIFTNDDNPNSRSPIEQAATITVARDCAQAGIEISLWHMDGKDHAFDPEKFYMQLSDSDDDDKPDRNTSKAVRRTVVMTGGSAGGGGAGKSGGGAPKKSAGGAKTDVTFKHERPVDRERPVSAKMFHNVAANDSEFKVSELSSFLQVYLSCFKLKFCIHLIAYSFSLLLPGALPSHELPAHAADVDAGTVAGRAGGAPSEKVRRDGHETSRGRGCQS